MNKYISIGHTMHAFARVRDFGVFGTIEYGGN